MISMGAYSGVLSSPLSLLLSMISLYSWDYKISREEVVARLRKGAGGRNGAVVGPISGLHVKCIYWKSSRSRRRSLMRQI